MDTLYGRQRAVREGRLGAGPGSRGLGEAMRAIHDEAVSNDTCGCVRMRQALLLKQPEGVAIPGERTVCRVMKEICNCACPLYRLWSTASFLPPGIPLSRRLDKAARRVVK